MATAQGMSWSPTVTVESPTATPLPWQLFQIDHPISAECLKELCECCAGLNTVEMLKIASSGLGMAPAQAMRIAESLYISGYLSYPRTGESDL
jgi:hypothetical protein